MKTRRGPSQGLVDEILGQAQAAITEADEGLQRAIEAARALGATWEMIGRSLGVTKQAVQSRFGGSGE